MKSYICMYKYTDNYSNFKAITFKNLLNLSFYPKKNTLEYNLELMGILLTTSLLYIA